MRTLPAYFLLIPFLYSFAVAAPIDQLNANKLKQEITNLPALFYKLKEDPNYIHLVKGALDTATRAAFEGTKAALSEITFDDSQTRTLWKARFKENTPPAGQPALEGYATMSYYSDGAILVLTFVAAEQVLPEAKSIGEKAYTTFNQAGNKNLEDVKVQGLECTRDSGTAGSPVGVLSCSNKDETVTAIILRQGIEQLKQNFAKITPCMDTYKSSDETFKCMMSHFEK